MKFNEYLKVINETAKKYNFNVEDEIVIDYDKHFISFDANELEYNELDDCLYEKCEIVKNENFYAIFKLEDGTVEIGFEW